jgi:hypothetical protein
MDQLYKATESVVVRRIAGETMLVPITSKLADMQKIFALDEVSALIWSLLDGKHSLQDIVADVTRDFDVTEEVATADAVKFIGELSEVGLVEQA